MLGGEQGQTARALPLHNAGHAAIILRHKLRLDEDLTSHEPLEALLVELRLNC